MKRHPSSNGGRTASLLGALAFAASLAACAASPDQPDADPSRAVEPAARHAVADYMPLNLGCAWTYRQRGPGKVGQFKVAVVRVENGYFVDNHGGMLRIDALGLRDPKRCLIHASPIPGRQWISQTALNRREMFEIVDDRLTVSVPAGTFADCLLVRSRVMHRPGEWETMEFAYAPGVGLARVQTFFEREGAAVELAGELALLSYEVP